MKNNFVAKNLHKSCRGSITPNKAKHAQGMLGYREDIDHALDERFEGLTGIYNWMDDTDLDDVSCSMIGVED